MATYEINELNIKSEVFDDEYYEGSSNPFNDASTQCDLNINEPPCDKCRMKLKARGLKRTILGNRKQQIIEMQKRQIERFVRKRKRRETDYTTIIRSLKFKIKNLEKENEMFKNCSNF